MAEQRPVSDNQGSLGVSDDVLDLSKNNRDEIPAEIPQNVDVRLLQEMLSNHSSELKREWKRDIGESMEILVKQGQFLQLLMKQCKEDRHVLNALTLAVSTPNVPKCVLSLRPQTRAQIATLDFYLSQEVFVKVGAHIILKYVIAHARNSDHSFENPHSTLELLFFAPPANMRQQERTTGHGKAFMDMRVSLTIEYVHNCCVKAKAVAKENSDILATANVQEIASSRINEEIQDYSPDQRHVDEAFVKQAVWTSEGYLSESDIRFACRHMVNKSGRRSTKNADGDGEELWKGKSRKYATLEEEIKQELVKDIWRRETEWLSFSRNDARRFLTKTIGFLFLPISHAKWEYIAPRDYYGKIDTVKLTRVYKGDDIGHLQIANRENGRHWEEMLKMFPRLRFRCSYDVTLCRDERTRGQKQDKVVRMEREICILDTALRFTTYYQQCECHEELMRLAPESLQVTYLVAMSFAAMLEEAFKVFVRIRKPSRNHDSEVPENSSDREGRNANELR